MSTCPAAVRRLCLGGGASPSPGTHPQTSKPGIPRRARPAHGWRTPGPLNVWGQTEHSNASRSQCLLPVSSDTLRTSRRTLSRDGLGEGRQASLTATYPPGVRTRTPSSPSSETWFLVWELKTNQKTKKHFSSQCPTSYSCAKNQINRRINKRKPKFDTCTRGVCMSLSISETMRLPWE